MIPRPTPPGASCGRCRRPPCNAGGRRIWPGAESPSRVPARELKAVGAELIVTDVDAGRARHVVEAMGARAVAPDEIYDAEADVFAPCALGGILNAGSIPRLRVEIVAGSANNQLLEAEDGDRLHSRGILYAPDYVTNAGGVIAIAGREVLGWDDRKIYDRVEAVFDTTREVFGLATETHVAPHVAADRLAEQRLAVLARERKGSDK
jgi:leucine dehydrogenase